MSDKLVVVLGSQVGPAFGLRVAGLWRVINVSKGMCRSVAWTIHVRTDEWRRIRCCR